jgi:hypothetical protein
MFWYVICFPSSPWGSCHRQISVRVSRTREINAQSFKNLFFCTPLLFDMDTSILICREHSTSARGASNTTLPVVEICGTIFFLIVPCQVCWRGLLEYLLFFFLIFFLVVDFPGLQWDAQAGFQRPENFRPFSFFELSSPSPPDCFSCWTHSFFAWDYPFLFWLLLSEVSDRLSLTPPTIMTSAFDHCHLWMS